MSLHDMADLVPLYALDALEGDENRSFESHLETCGDCQASLAEYRLVAANLVLDEPASDETWDRISAAIASESETSAEVIPLQRLQGNGVWKWMSGIAAAAAAVFGVMVLTDGVQGDQLSSEGIVAAAGQVAEEPGAVVSEFLVDDVAVAQVVLSADGRGFVIPTDELDAIEVERTYQLWVINDNEEVISAGVLGNSPEPATFTWTGEVTGFALTREVAGGVISSAGDVVSVISDV